MDYVLNSGKTLLHFVVKYKKEGKTDGEKELVKLKSSSGGKSSGSGW